MLSVKISRDAVYLTIILLLAVLLALGVVINAR
jgi:hypothetical protein